MKNTDVDDVLNSDAFFSFVSKEFDEVAGEATLEELAEFAFGSLDEAKEAFENSSN